MQLTININLDNAAYEGADLVPEIADNLEAVIQKLCNGHKDGIIKDSNGNKVGHWSICEEDYE